MVGYDPSQSVTLTNRDYVMAGMLSGFTSRLVVQPFDVVKIRLQLQVEPVGKSRALGTKLMGKYTGVIQTFQCILKEEGFSAMWKGHTPAQIQAVFFSLTQFFTFEICTKHIWQQLPSSITSSYEPVGHFICGNIAGCAAAACTQPFDVLRTRFIAQGEPKIYLNIWDAFRYIFRKEGVRGYYRGLLPSLMLIAPQTGLQFAFYKHVNDWFSSWRLNQRKILTGDKDLELNLDDKAVGAFQSLFAGGIAGMLSKTCVYPLDFVKKRMQVQGFEEARVKFGKLHTSKGFFQCFSVILKEEGPTAFFKGLKPALLKACLSIAVRFAAYEQFCNLMRFIHQNSSSSR